jgi:hypothetical protein
VDKLENVSSMRARIEAEVWSSAIT